MKNILSSSLESNSSNSTISSTDTGKVGGSSRLKIERSVDITSAITLSSDDVNNYANRSTFMLCKKVFL